MTADYEYLTDTWVSSWGGSLGRGSLEAYLNDHLRLGWELVSAVQILQGHDMKGEVGCIWKVPVGTVEQFAEESRQRAVAAKDEVYRYAWPAR